MSIVLCSPYGGYKTPEAGLLYLLGRYLAARGSAVSQLKCNGVLPVCDRDAESNWRRPVSGCFACMQDQRDLSAWSGIGTIELSTFLSPDDVQRTARWVNGLSDEELSAAEFDGVNVSDRAAGTFAHRFDVPKLDLHNKQHVRFQRVLLLTAARLRAALKNFSQRVNPAMMCSPGGDNVFSASVQDACARTQTPVILLDASLAQRCVVLRRADGSIHECPLFIEDVLSLRNDVQTWSPELLRLLGEVETWLGVEPLPAASTGS